MFFKWKADYDVLGVSCHCSGGPRVGIAIMEVACKVQRGWETQTAVSIWLEIPLSHLWLVPVPVKYGAIKCNKSCFDDQNEWMLLGRREVAGSFLRTAGIVPYGPFLCRPLKLE